MRRGWKRCAAAPWGGRFQPGRANIWNGRTHHAETKADGFTYTAPVRSFPPNAWGLHDVIGNVFEYCSGLPALLQGREAELIAGRGGSWWCSSGTCDFFISFPKLAKRFGNAPASETLSPLRLTTTIAFPRAHPPATETEFRLPRPFPKRCANFGNESARE